MYYVLVLFFVDQIIANNDGRVMLGAPALLSVHPTFFFISKLSYVEGTQVRS